MVGYLLFCIQSGGFCRTTGRFVWDDWSSNACALILLTFYISLLMILEWLCSPERTFLPVARHHHLGRCLVCSAVSGINFSLLGAEFSLLTWSALFVLQDPTQFCGSVLCLSYLFLEERMADCSSQDSTVVAGEVPACLFYAGGIHLCDCLALERRFGNAF